METKTENEMENPPTEASTTKKDIQIVSIEVADLFAHLFDDKFATPTNLTGIQNPDFDPSKEIQPWWLN